MLRRLIRHPRTQAFLTDLVVLYLAAVFRTMRWTVEGADHVVEALAEAHDDGRPPAIIFTFWHERLPVMANAWRLVHRDRPATRGHRVHVLVSRHRDGRLIGDIISRFELAPVHASTSKGGAAGLRNLARLVGHGESVAITPDGPRGPRREAAPGVAQLAALSGRPVLPCAAATSRSVELGTWDRMIMPLPFARGVLIILPAIHVGRHDAVGEALPAIEAAMTAACRQADARFGRG
jgi:lysophospholipid acyltransferase (LPLAT)-like uncharacterized protein